MKKVLSVLFILLMSASVYAKKNTRVNDTKNNDTNRSSGSINFDFELYGLVYGLTGAQGEYMYDGSHIRIRPGFIMSNSDMKAVMRLEVDQNFGRGDTTRDADPGTDNFAIEVKHAYLETQESLLRGLVLMAGLNSYSFPVVFDNDFAMIQASYDLGFCKPLLSLIAIDEFSEVEKTASGVEQDTDLRGYAADIPFRFGGFAIRPMIIHLAGGGGSPTASQGRLTIVGVNLTGDVDFALLKASGAYMLGDLEENLGTSAYAFDVELEIKPSEGISIGGFFTFGSGDDGSDPEKNNAFFYNMNNLFGRITTKTGAPDGRLFLLENATVANSLTGEPASGFDYMDSQLGYMSFGAYAEAGIGDFTALARFGMALLVEEDADGNNAIGSEIDLKVSYGIVESTSVFVEGAYIIAGDVLEENVYQAAFGMTTEF
mgnify:CR=1 FL=1